MSVVHTFTNDPVEGAGGWVTPSLQVGDIVVAVIGRDERYNNVALRSPTMAASTMRQGLGWVPIPQIPGGFQPLGDNVKIVTFPSGERSEAAATVTGASWALVEEPGSFEVRPAGGSGKFYLAALVLRGPTSLAAVDMHARNAQPFDYPGLDLVENMSGDVLHIGYHKREHGYQIPASDSTVATQEVTGTGRQMVWRDSVRGGYWTYYGGGTVKRESLISVGHDTLTGTDTVPATTGGDRIYGAALTVLFADVSGPSAPTITTPEAGTLDLASGFTLEWVPSFEPQSGFAVRRKLESWPWESWDGTQWVEGTDQIVLDGDATTLPVTGDSIVNDGSTWTYEVATVGGVFKPMLGAWASVALTAVAPPPAPGLTVSDTTGGDLTSFMPTITLTGGPQAGQTLTGYRVTIDQGDYRHTQEIETSTPGASWTVPIDVASNLVNQGEWVTISAVTVQNDTQVSDETWQIFTLNVPRPDTPTVTVTAIDHPVSGAPGHLVEVTPGEPLTGTYEVARVDRHGRTVIWDGPISSGWLVADYLAPTTGAVRWEARVTTDAVAPVESLWGTSAIVDHAHSCGWIIDPLRPDTAVQAGVMSIGDRVTDLRTQAMAPLGQPGWIVHAGVAVDEVGSLTVEVEGDEHLTRLRALLTSGARLFVRGWRETGTRNPRARGTALDVWVRLTGELTVTRPLEGPHATRDVTISFVQVDPPEWT